MIRARNFVPLLILFLAAAAFLAGPAQTDPRREGTPAAPELVRLDARLDKLIPIGAKIEVVVSGQTWVEGPLWNRKENYLLFSDVPRNTIYQWREGAALREFLKPSGYTGTAPFAGEEPGSNGLTWDRQGRLVMCEHGDRRISRYENGTKTTLVDRYQGKRLNSPNDVVFKSDGDFYFTDPPFGLPKAFDDPAKELAFQGVYRVNPNSEVTLLTQQFKAPNGIAFSPDEKKLYISNIKPGPQAWWVFDVNPDGTIGNGRVFADAAPYEKNGGGGPDGLKLDAHGNLFASGPGSFYIFAPDGTLLGRIHTGSNVSNVAWGGADGSVMFLTAGKYVYRVKTTTRGAGW